MVFLQLIKSHFGSKIQVIFCFYAQGSSYQPIESCHIYTERKLTKVQRTLQSKGLYFWPPIRQNCVNLILLMNQVLISHLILLVLFHSTVPSEVTLSVHHKRRCLFSFHTWNYIMGWWQQQYIIVILSQHEIATIFKGITMYLLDSIFCNWFHIPSTLIIYWRLSRHKNLYGRKSFDSILLYKIYTALINNI